MYSFNLRIMIKLCLHLRDLCYPQCYLLSPRLTSFPGAGGSKPLPCWHLCLAPTVVRQSGPRPDPRLLRQAALEALTNSARTDSPRRVGRKQLSGERSGGGGGGDDDRRRRRRLMRGRGGGQQALGIGYPHMSASDESSTTMYRLLHASGSHPIPPPDDPKTNQYNQDLGLIHSTNGNHLESSNEGSSIDHQITIYLHAQNITMFPTNETCWWICVRVSVGCSAGVDVNAGQLSCSSKRKRRRVIVATGSPAARRAAIPHSHLPAGIVATMRRVVNYHSSWARQQQVELFDASGNPGSTAGRGFNPAGGSPRGG
ncbi:hypothetical protein F511_26622 [Dorcoceras hygrometricum]|uniref:Uncharacterized protein n=1 Tax=Dorcoceras hygrometricum TaxID=472368 RepID=A0A2Z7BX55_9LAMI|nr:hypothetical protein F511_26622 [Dorcoceras hygrometricum]